MVVTEHPADKTQSWGVGRGCLTELGPVCPQTLSASGDSLVVPAQDLRPASVWGARGGARRSARAQCPRGRQRLTSVSAETVAPPCPGASGVLHVVSVFS